MTTYRLTSSDVVLRVDDNTSIPNDPANRDRQQYEEWLADGGVPDPYLVPLPSATFDWGPRFVQVIGQEK